MGLGCEVFLKRKIHLFSSLHIIEEFITDLTIKTLLKNRHGNRRCHRPTSNLINSIYYSNNEVVREKRDIGSAKQQILNIWRSTSVPHLQAVNFYLAHSIIIKSDTSEIKFLYKRYLFSNFGVTLHIFQFAKRTFF